MKCGREGVCERGGGIYEDLKIYSKMKLEERMIEVKELKVRGM